MKAALLVLAALVALPACSLFNKGKGEVYVPPGYQRIDFAGARASAAERATCERAGGTVVPSGKLQWENCVQPLMDAGTACAGSADCIGECRYEGDTEPVQDMPVTGTCQATDARFGCHTVVEGGRIAHTICVD
mgnify:CR=1 FL=1|jgi:hypothetical protein